jgi:hypothetical protein
MSKIANVTFTTQLQDKPEGAVVGGYSVVLSKAGAAVETKVVPDNVTPVQFDIASPGDYTVQVARVDSNTGVNISPVVESAPFTIVPDQIEVPLAITVTVAETIAVPAEVTVTT